MGGSRSRRSLDVIVGQDRRLASLQTSRLLWYEHACCFLKHSYVEFGGGPEAGAQYI
jgi:hypothetical protein